MTSNALTMWNHESLPKLEEIEKAHQAIGGTGPGRRSETQQLNFAMALLLSAEFQGYCRELHDECVQFIATEVGGPGGAILRSELVKSRKVDSGNPNPGNLGADFGRFGIEFWPEVRKLDRRNQARQDGLEQLNQWRNAISHHQFDPPKLGLASGNISLQLATVRRWRDACNQLSIHFDLAIKNYLTTQFGKSPW